MSTLIKSPRLCDRGPECTGSTQAGQVTSSPLYIICRMYKLSQAHPTILKIPKILASKPYFPPCLLCPSCATQVSHTLQAVTPPLPNNWADFLEYIEREENETELFEDPDTNKHAEGESCPGSSAQGLTSQPCSPDKEPTAA
eukprot:TRINITY_DN15183_c0_g2_i1.p1 TRINITY_DN15183_c0_g2~~TRINITY_DN15183_c0_g2_i1.p1  ORF type:complete len:142 (+),score=11.76 TRINITY_DN15183_c0_g2_i1:129-554(+)